MRTPLRELLFFDFKERKWSSGQEKPNKPIFGHSANVLGDELIVFGGCDGKILLKDFRIFDFSSKTFQNLITKSL